MMRTRENGRILGWIRGLTEEEIENDSMDNVLGTLLLVLPSGLIFAVILVLLEVFVGIMKWGTEA
jgi:hypothetical protein